MRNLRTWAIIFLSALVMVLSVVVVVQAVMLRSRGWTVPLGNVAEWVAGVGTMAAFGALFYAAKEWRAAQTERRDGEAEQARLIVAEPLEPGQPIEGLLRKSKLNDFVVRNHSESPVFNLDIEGLDDTADTLVFQGVPVAAMAQQHPDMFRPRRVSVLQPGRATDTLTVMGGSEAVPKIEHLTFEFTDAKGRRWKRTGSGQPVRVFSG